MDKLNDQAMRLALERLEADRAATVAGSGLVEEFEAALLVAARALPDQRGRVAFATDYLRLRTGAPTREVLREVIARHFDGETVQRLAALSGLMDAGQLAQVFDRIGADNKSLTGMFETVINTSFFDLCEEFEPHPRPGFHDPVTAPIPTLVMQGALDTQTAPSRGL
jgi:hypothetical protein